MFIYYKNLNNYNHHTFFKLTYIYISDDDIYTFLLLFTNITKWKSKVTSIITTYNLLNCLAVRLLMAKRVGNSTLPVYNK